MDKSKLLKLAKMVMKFKEISTDKGTLITDEFAVGVEVFIETEEGKYIPATDGEYVTENQKITIKDGKIESIEDNQPIVEELVQESDEKDLRIAELEGLLKDRDAIISELTAKIKELEDKINKPVEEPIEMQAVVDDQKVKANPALRYFQN